MLDYENHNIIDETLVYFNDTNQLRRDQNHHTFE